MRKALFADFYGTLVYEDGEVIKKVSQEIYDTGVVKDKSEIGKFWWEDFQKAFTGSFGENFETQRKLEYDSLKRTIEHFHSSADAEKLSNMMFDYWREPPIFEETKDFFREVTVPVYIVSNIDREDIFKALEYHRLKPTGVITSEDARSYKPRKELFEMALTMAGLSRNEVIHIGDSLTSDIKGAAAAGIEGIWINRSGREVPDGVKSADNLLKVLNFL